MPVAEVDLLQSLLLAIAVSAAMAWTWTVFICFADLIRDRALSGWRRAGWVLVLLVPLLGCLAYLIARGSGMEARAVDDHRQLWK